MDISNGLEVRKFYIRYREGLPDNTIEYAAWDGMRRYGVETTPCQQPMTKVIGL